MPAPRKRNDSHTSRIYDHRTEDNLKEHAKLFRQAFVREYIKDYHAAMALARCGHEGSVTTLRNRSSQLLREPYVQCLLDEMVRTLRPEDVVTRQQVMSRMWAEANDPCNTGGERIVACAHVGKMLGMYQDNKEENNQTPIGVMLIPVMDVKDWSASAAQAQALLKRNAADDTSRADCPPPPPPQPAQGLN